MNTDATGGGCSNTNVCVLKKRIPTTPVVMSAYKTQNSNTPATDELITNQEACKPAVEALGITTSGHGGISDPTDPKGCIVKEVSPGNVWSYHNPTTQEVAVHQRYASSKTQDPFHLRSTRRLSSPGLRRRIRHSRKPSAKPPRRRPGRPLILRFFATRLSDLHSKRLVSRNTRTEGQASQNCGENSKCAS